MPRKRDARRDSLILQFGRTCTICGRENLTSKGLAIAPGPKGVTCAQCTDCRKRSELRYLKHATRVLAEELLDYDTEQFCALSQQTVTITGEDAYRLIEAAKLIIARSNLTVGQALETMPLSREERTRALVRQYGEI